MRCDGVDLGHNLEPREILTHGRDRHRGVEMQDGTLEPGLHQSLEVVQHHSAFGAGLQLGRGELDPAQGLALAIEDVGHGDQEPRHRRDALVRQRASRSRTTLFERHAGPHVQRDHPSPLLARGSAALAGLKPEPAQDFARDRGRVIVRRKRALDSMHRRSEGIRREAVRLAALPAHRCLGKVVD